VRQVNGTMAIARERRGEECVCKCVSNRLRKRKDTRCGMGDEGEPEARACLAVIDREARVCAGCGAARTCTTRHAWGEVMGGGQGGARCGGLWCAEAGRGEG
jgi:hypothetical protein